MKKLFVHLSRNPLDIFLLAIPLAVLAEVAQWGAIWVFALSALGVIPLAGYIGKSTEVLAVFTGPKIGGLLNATLGNAAELIITLVAIQAGLLDLVKASITGSIIGNLLLVMGAAMIFGGVKNGIQKFDRRQATNHCTLLALTIVALVVPSFFSHSIGPETSLEVEELSLGVAAVMIVLYGLAIFYSLKTSSAEPSPISAPSSEPKHHPTWSLTKAIVILSIATVGVVVMSEMLVGAVETVVARFGLSEFFLGIILIPIVGNVAEHLVAVQVAIRNQMDLSVEIAVSSSLQIALFVAPLLVFISLAMGHPLTLIFNTFELLALGAAVWLAGMVSNDGESNWLEGTALLAVYLILGISFFFLPA